MMTKDTKAHGKEVPGPPTAQAREMLLTECVVLFAFIMQRGRAAPVNEHLLCACHVCGAFYATALKCCYSFSIPDKSEDQEVEYHGQGHATEKLWRKASNL